MHVQAVIVFVNPGVGLVKVDIPDVPVLSQQKLNADFGSEQELPSQILVAEFGFAEHKTSTKTDNAIDAGVRAENHLRHGKNPAPFITVTAFFPQHRRANLDGRQYLETRIEFFLERQWLPDKHLILLEVGVVPEFLPEPNAYLCRHRRICC